MISIHIKRTYKYSYIIERNRREIARFYNKKHAIDMLYQLYKRYNELNKTDSHFHFVPVLLFKGQTLVLYTSARRTLGDNSGDDFKDYFTITRQKNF